MAIHRSSLVEITMGRIKTHILENELKANDKFLSEKELVNQLQVSRTVVREALRSLESVGIIKIKPGDGIFVGSSNFDSIKAILKHHYETYGVKIRELIEIRKIIELGALRLIIEKDIDINVNYLEELNEEYYQAITNKTDTKKFDQLLHQHIMKETDNQTFYNFAEVIQEYFSLAKIDLIQNNDSLLKSHQEHTEIIQSIKNKDLDYGHKIMAEHFEPVFHYIYQMEGQSSNGTN